MMKLDEHLKRVSRSFAFCIEQLDRPLRGWVGLSYILCRLADSVEDSIWPEPAAQVAAFDRLRSFVDRASSKDEVAEWSATFPSSIPQGEKLLLNEASLFFEELHALPLEVRSSVQRAVLSMIGGMEFHVRRELASTSEANEYCFFVAGLVGELLTDLVKLAHPEFKPDERVYGDAFHFGLYLQKINLLKDQQVDEREGRRLVPSRQEMKESLVVNAAHAMNYLESIPVALRGYRIFCAWSFFLGLLSLPYIEKSWTEQSTAKVSRAETMLFLGRVYLMVGDNAALRKLYESYLPLFKDVGLKPPPAVASAPSWFSKIYNGKLTSNVMAELSMFTAESK